MRQACYASLLFLSLFSCLPSVAQDAGNSQAFKKKGADSLLNRCYFRELPLSYYAYQKMLRNHYNFTILGTQSPVSGFTFETDKPSITLKGNIYSAMESRLLVNLELTGGADNDLLKIFSGDKLNGLFKASLGFNYLLKKPNIAKYSIDDDFTKDLLKKTSCDYRETIAKKIDTLLVLKGFGEMRGIVPDSIGIMADYLLVESKKKIYVINDYQNRMKRDEYRDYYKKLIPAILKKYTTDTVKGNDNELFRRFIKELGEKENKEILSGDLLADLSRLSGFTQDVLYKYRLIDQNDIDTYKDVWRFKQISWLNVSVAGGNATFSLYDTIGHGMDGSHSFTASVSVTYNFLKKWTAANRYFYMRTGITFKKSNSLIDLETFDFKNTTAVVGSGTGQITTEESGTAYKGKLVDGIGFDFPIEIYWAPWNQDAIPGFYTKLMYSYGAPWINKNKIRLDLGLVWNVLNGDPDNKSVLTITPYVSWTNLVEEYKDAARTVKKDLSDLFSIGVKIGVPVNLGK